MQKKLGSPCSVDQGETGRAGVCIQIFLTRKPMLLTTIINSPQTTMLNNSSRQGPTTSLKDLEMLDAGEQEELFFSDANSIQPHWKMMI